jgi:competence protein ComEA
MKSHFQFTNKQRSGIFLLLLLLIIVQCIYVFVDFSKKETPTNRSQLDSFRNELDSLRLVEQEANTPKIYPFNPNFITDYKGYNLGMSTKEIDLLHQYREGNHWVNSVNEFQQITKVSDSLLAAISPYFKFPDWVTNPKPKTKAFKNSFSNSSKPKTYDQKIDLNKASAMQLQKVYGIGEKLSERILKYRGKFPGGFIADLQLSEVYGLSPEVIKRLTNDFTVKTPREIKTFNLNTATRDELVTIQYIDYEVANNIIEERTLRDGFNTMEELTKVEDFPIKKIDIIRLYLHL